MGGGKLQSEEAQDEGTNNNLQVQMTPEFPSYQHEDSRMYATATLTAPAIEVEVERSEIDLVVVLDQSGSMSGDKLTLAKKATEFVLTQMRDVDRVAIVTYDSNIAVRMPLTKMDSNGVRKTEKAVKQIQAGSATNLSGGLLKGMELMNERSTKAPVASVMLMTDGLVNGGIQDQPGIIAAMREMMKGHEDYSIYTFGYGDQHNSDLLKAISESGNGMYYFIEDNDMIPEAFADCLGGLLTTVAQNISVSMEAINGATITSIMTTRQHSVSADGKTAEINLGDLQSEESRDVLIELSLPNVDQDSTQDYLTASVSALLVEGGQFVEESATLGLDRLSDLPEDRQPNAHVLQQRLREQTVKILKDARDLSQRGNLEEARQMLTQALEQDIGSFAGQYEFVEELCDDLRVCLDAIRSEAEWRSRGAYEMSSCMQSHAMQRCNKFSSDRFASYETSAKKCMKSKATFFK